MTNSDAGREPSMMANVNGVIDQLHRSLGLAESDFFCECGHIGCKERITLTRTQYANLREDNRPVLVAEHAHRGTGVVAEPHGFRVATRTSHLSGAPHGR